MRLRRLFGKPDQLARERGAENKDGADDSGKRHGFAEDEDR